MVPHYNKGTRIAIRIYRRHCFPFTVKEIEYSSGGKKERNSMQLQLDAGFRHAEAKAKLAPG